MTAEDLARLREVVLADPDLQRRLLAAAGRREFAALVVGLAADRGLEVSDGDVDDALTESRRQWYSRWI